MFDEKIKELKATIETLSSTIATKTAEVKASLEAEDLETAKALKADVESAKADLATANENLSLFEEMLKTGGAENKGGREVPQEELTYREKVEAFIHSKGAVEHEGLRFGDTRDEVLISGSPPRVRVKRSCESLLVGDVGITPARAGKTGHGILIGEDYEDHPRACG